MKKKLLFLLLIFSTQVTFAQEKLDEMNIILGKPYPVVDADSKYYFTHKDKMISIKIKGKEFILQTFDSKQLTQLKVKIYKDFPKDFMVEKFMELKDRIFLFYSLWDKENKKEQLYVREIDVEKCSFIGTGKLVFDVNGKVTGTLVGTGFYSYGTADKFDFISSFDKNKLLIQYRKNPTKKNDDISKDKIGFNVYDENLKLIWEKEVTMPYTEKKMDILDYSIDSDGNVYIASLIYRDNTTNKLTKDKNINYDIELIKIETKTGQLTQTKISLENKKFVSSLRLFETAGNRIVCAGYYSNGGKNGKDFSDANGIFKFDLGKGNTDPKIDYYDIPLEIINQNVKQKEVKKNNKKKDAEGKAALADLELEVFYLSTDGSIYFIGEQQFYITRTYTDSKGNSRTTTTYYYNDILITKINKDGSLAWMKKLPKKQRGSRPKGGLSFTFVEGGKNLNLIYMDNVKNLTLTSTDVPEYHVDGAGGFLTAYKVNFTNGDVKKTSILNSVDVKGMKIYQFSTDRISSNVNDEFIFEVYKKQKEDILIKVKLK